MCRYPSPAQVLSRLGAHHDVDGLAIEQAVLGAAIVAVYAGCIDFPPGRTGGRQPGRSLSRRRRARTGHRSGRTCTGIQCAERAAKIDSSSGYCRQSSQSALWSRPATAYSAKKPRGRLGQVRTSTRYQDCNAISVTKRQPGQAHANLLHCPLTKTHELGDAAVPILTTSEHPGPVGHVYALSDNSLRVIGRTSGRTPRIPR